MLNNNYFNTIAKSCNCITYYDLIRNFIPDDNKFYRHIQNETFVMNKFYGARITTSLLEIINFHNPQL